MHTSRVLYGLGIFTFFFYFAKVSSAPNLPTIETIIDAMKHDTKLCTLPTFLYENNVTKECLNVTYPEKSLQPKCKFMDTFLCLAFYDTLYKVCQFKQFQKPFNNVTTFYTYMQKYFPGETEADQTMFCENIKDLTFSYEKIKPLLPPIHLNNSRVCYSVCFDLTGKFIPLCAILSWSKSIDDDAKEKNKNEQTDLPDGVSDAKVVVGSQEAKQQVQDSRLPLAQTSNEIRNKNVNSDTKEDKVNPSNDRDKLKDTQKEESTNKAASDKTLVDMSSSDQLAENKDTSTVVKSKNANLNQQSSVNSSSSSVLSQHKEPVKDKNDEKAEDSKKFENRNNGNPVNNDNMWNIDEANEEMKANTISEDTQDHETSANQNDRNRAKEEKLSNNANDGPDLPIDTDEQAQSIPDPSEQRETSHIHNIASEEDSHFFTYFTVVSIIFIAAYVGYHNKQKILAIVLEGRRSRNSRSRRRPSTASYRKLNCTLEEAVTSQCNANVTHVLY
ncbi:Trans-Golgi network integral membrane protein TGN38 [Anthophora retusa]